MSGPMIVFLGVLVFTAVVIALVVLILVGADERWFPRGQCIWRSMKARN